MPKVLIPLAQGCEELEAVTMIDLLRRAGVEVVTAGLDDLPVRASRGTRLIPDTTLDRVLNDSFDMVALPGGLPGADHLRKDERVVKLLQRMAAEDQYLAAICAAPAVLAHAGLLAGRRATSYPGVLENLHRSDITISSDAVVKDGRILTSRGPGTALDFALELIETLCGPAKRREVEEKLAR